MTSALWAMRWCEAQAGRAFTWDAADAYLALVAAQPTCSNAHLLRAMLAVGQTVPPGKPSWAGLQAYWRNWTTRVRGWLGVDAALALGFAHGAVTVPASNTVTPNTASMPPTGAGGTSQVNTASSELAVPVCAISEARLRQLWTVICARFALPVTEVTWHVGATRAETRICFGTLVVAVRAGASWAAWAEALHECGHAAWRMAVRKGVVAHASAPVPAGVQYARSLDEGIAECFSGALMEPWFCELVQAWSRESGAATAPANLAMSRDQAPQAQRAKLAGLARQQRAARYQIAVELAGLEADLARGECGDGGSAGGPPRAVPHVPWALWHQPGTAQSYLAAHAWCARLAPAFAAGGTVFWHAVAEAAGYVDAQAEQWLKEACHHCGHARGQPPAAGGSAHALRGEGHARQS